MSDSRTWSDLSDSEKDSILADLAAIKRKSDREAAAKKLGGKYEVGQRALLADCKEFEPEPEKDEGPETLADLEPEPWEEPVNLAELLDEMVTEIRKYMLMDDQQIHAVALWIAFTHVFKEFYWAPYLLVFAPEPQCGKTTLLDVIRSMVRRCLRSGGMTAAVLTRLIGRDEPTIVLDEFDTMYKNEGLRQVLDEGFKKDGVIHKCVGDDHEPTAFPIWCPKAFGGIGLPHQAVLSRTVRVSLKRKLGTEKKTVFRSHEATQFQDLHRKLIRWADDHGSKLKRARPHLGDLANRQADIWLPLLAIAEQAKKEGEQGKGKWAGYAMAAAISTAKQEEESYRIALLRDIRDVFYGTHEGVAEEGITDLADVTKMAKKTIGTTALILTLKENEESQWATFGRSDSGLTAHALGNILRKFDIHSQRLTGNQRGWARTQFDDTWARYCPPLKLYTDSDPLSQPSEATKRQQESEPDRVALSDQPPSEHGSMCVESESEAESGGNGRFFALDGDPDDPFSDGPPEDLL